MPYKSKNVVRRILRKIKETPVLQRVLWRARRDSNSRPSDSKSEGQVALDFAGFSILATCESYWHPVERAKPPKMDGPPGGIVSSAVQGARPGIKQTRVSAKWETLPRNAQRQRRARL